VFIDRIWLRSWKMSSLYVPALRSCPSASVRTNYVIALQHASQSTNPAANALTGVFIFAEHERVTRSRSPRNAKTCQKDLTVVSHRGTCDCDEEPRPPPPSAVSLPSLAKLVALGTSSFSDDHHDDAQAAGTLIFEICSSAVKASAVITNVTTVVCQPWSLGSDRIVCIEKGLMLFPGCVDAATFRIKNVAYRGRCPL
jgi:hypothetical protein